MKRALQSWGVSMKSCCVVQDKGEWGLLLIKGYWVLSAGCVRIRLGESGCEFETTQTNHPQFRKSKHLKTARGFCLQNLVLIPSVYSDSLRILKQPKHPTAYWHCVDRTVHLLVPFFFFFFF